MTSVPRSSEPSSDGLARARHSGAAADLFREIDRSIGFDMRLYRYDIAQSRAHARMLCGRGIIDEGDLDEIVRGLDRVETEFDEGKFAVRTQDDDIHMAVERRLTEIVGPVGGKLHTGRSRNDQVATDLAMYVRDAAVSIDKCLAAIMTTLLALGERHAKSPMPGYTHLQRAKPVYLGQHLLAYFWMFNRDRGRFSAAARSAQVLPLGAGALAGVNWDVDPGRVADELGFSSLAENSIDAVSNRDFALDFLAAAATCATHLSRLGAELVLWSSEEFGFVELPDSLTSGSSIMPQKKNPDAAELLRAKAPRIVSHLTALHGVLHGLPLTYNKDMQEDKEPVFDAADTLDVSLRVADAMLADADFDTDKMAAAASGDSLIATDVADYLVRKGHTFREAHAIVGALVKYSMTERRSLSSLDLQEIGQFSERVDDEYYRLFEEGASQRAKISPGGLSRVRMEAQINAARDALRGDG